MLTNDEMCMSRRSFQIWSAPQFMPWGAIRGCFSAVRKFCVPSRALINLFGQLAVGSLVLALELFAMSRISLTERQASKGILLHYENLFGLHGRRESFLD